MLPVALFEAGLDLGFEPFTVIPSSTIMYQNFNDMTLFYSHK